MGAAALSTTSFPIKRERVAHLLGFANVIENSYDAVAGADYLLEVSSLLMVMMTNTSRWIHDFLLLATKEYDGITVAKPYVQISSIMPQKRNPVSIEHARAITSSALGEAFTVFQMILVHDLVILSIRKMTCSHIYIKGLKRLFVFFLL